MLSGSEYTTDDAPLDIWEEFLFVAFFFTSAGTVFYISLKKRNYQILSYAFPIQYLAICLLVYSGQHRFHQVRQQCFFGPHFQQTFVAIIF